MGFKRRLRRWTWSGQHTFARARALLRRNGLEGLVHAVWRRAHRAPAAPGLETVALDPTAERERIQVEMAGFASRPFFSLIFVPGAASPEEIAPTLASVDGQLYREFELFLAPGPRLAGRAETILAQADWPAGLRPGWCALLYPGMILAPELLFELAKTLQTQPRADLLYPDHDVIGSDPALAEAVLKPDWSPDFLLCGDYIGGPRFFATDFVRQAARASALDLRDPALAYDLSLRAIDWAAVVHIPLVLASLTPAFAPPDPLPSQRAWLERQGLRARLESLPGRPALAIPHFELPPIESVSIVICSHDQPELLQACLESIFGLTRGIDFEVVLVDHASRQQATRQLIADWQRKEPRRLLVERAEGAFNFSSLNNAGVRHARGRYLTLLNDDIEVISPDWLLEMAGWAQRPTVGVVGACLLYPNDTIQHGGILLGMRDLAVHAMKGRRASDPGFMQRLRVPSNFLALTGACLMLRRELYAELGGLDERFAVAGGDINLCLQASARGYFNLLLPQVRLYHYESATRGFEDSPAKQARLRQEYDLLRQRWPAQVSGCDPFYHPALERVRGDFSR